MEGSGTRTGTELVRRLGGEAALPALRKLGVCGDDTLAPGGEPLAAAIAASPVADYAVPTLARLAERQPEVWRRLTARDELVIRVATVAGTSDALGDLLVRSSAAVAVLTGDLGPRDADAVRQEATATLTRVEDAGDDFRAAAALLAFQRRGLLRVAARDLLGLADTPTVAAELADLAEGVIGAALDLVLADADARLVVVGMGKLGGRELNYVSDVDLMFVGDGEPAVTTRAAERLMRLLGATTPEGRTYEIDANLRPEGRDGPLVRSLEAYEAYYGRWAKTWEFQALLKARPVAGEPELAERFTVMVAPYLWPDRLDPEQVRSIQRMKGVVERSEPVRRHGQRQLKLAPGGLRDIEFAVQLLQLVHGRHDESLRSPTTLAALAALADGGYVDDGDAQLFDDAYQFLRTVEHRLQLRKLRRTHTVPERDEERYRLARTVGFRDIRAATALEQFDREYRRVQGYTRRLHEKLFYRPLLERFGQVGRAERLGDSSLGLAEVDARERLAALGFHDPDGALVHLDALASGLSRRARLFRTLLPALLPTLAAAPDPDAGLRAFRSLADRLGEAPSFLRTLRDNPPVGELLARILGASRVAGEWLERQPDVVGTLSDLPALQTALAPADYRRLADGLVRRRSGDAEASAALRRLRRREAVRIAVRDLGGFADVREVGNELTGLAEACLEAALAVAVPEGVRMAVIGMGKLGAAELAYASDLDVLLVFEPAEAREDGLRAAERLLGLLSAITPEGQAFRVDLGLRPEGKDGPLARTLDAYAIYYERWGEPWEFQALTLARPVAGDPELGAAFLELIAPHVFPADPSRGRLQAVRQMKARMERERGADREPAVRRRTGGAARPGRSRRPQLASAATGERVDLKLGPGGLADVEWTVQLLQLREGGRVASLRKPGTLDLLEALVAADALRSQDAAWLAEGWTLCSRVRNALYLMGARDTAVVPSGHPLEHLARMLDYTAPGAQALTQDLGRALRRVRKVHERHFYD